MDEKQISELLECSVCLERFDQSCKVLPCQHTFCRQCLDEIILTKHELRCPECRALVTVRVADLPTNILVVRILEGLKTKGHRSSGGSVKQPDHGSLGSSPSKGGGGSGQIPVHDSISGHGFRQGSQPCVKALYNYGSAEKEDLSFKKGDVILLKRKIDDNWFHGEIGGRSGFFPSNFVQVLVPLPQIPQCVSLYDFELKDEGEKDCLSFKKDEVLTVIRQVDENWLEGRKGDKIGIFPITFVKLNDSAKSLINTKSNLAIIPGSSSSCSNTPATITALSNTTTAAGTTVPSSYSKADPSSTAVVGSTATGSTSAVASSTISGTTNAAGCTSSSSSPPPSSSLSVSTPNIDDLITVLAAGTTISAEAVAADPVVSSGVASTTNPHPDPALVSTFLPQALPETASEPEVLSQNKRHSFTSASLSSPMYVAPAGSTPHAQQRHSAEVTLTAGGALSLVSSELVASSLSSSSLSSLPSAVASETQPAASSSPKNTSSSPVHTEAAIDIPASSSSSGDTAQSGSLTTPLYSALYNYKPRKDDELELHKGDHYSVSEKCQDGWYKGMCVRSGMAGVFPGNYVQLIRHTSAFKPVSSNMINVKPKASAVPHSSTAAVAHSVPVSDPRPVNQTSSETSLSQAPPLMPRVAKMNAAGQKSRSPLSQLAGTPLRSLSSPGTCTQSLSSSSSPKHVLSSLASSTQPPSSHSGSSHMGLSHPLIPAPPPSTTSFPHRSLWVPPSPAALQTSMSASANITPPNVVAAQGLNPAAQTQAPTVKDKRKKQDKEKKGLVKLLSGKSKKSKQAIPVEPEPIQALAVVLGFDNGVHVRSGSYPVNGTTSSGLVGAGGDGSLICAHRKAASFDATTVPPVPAKPRPKLVVRERYCCIVPYPPQTEQELELELGDIIHVHRKREDGWYKGTQERTGKTGMFPASFVEKCD